MAFASEAFLAVRVVAVLFILAALVCGARNTVRWVWVARETGIAAGAYLLYFLVRGITAGHEQRAGENARRLVDVERSAGIFHEVGFQSLIIEHRWLINLANWIYIWGHWPFILIVAVWLLLYHPHAYITVRNAFLVSGGAGLVIFAFFPVAPPRLLDLELRDTITEYSEGYRLFQPRALVNQVAAMPSLHFGWNLLIGVALVRIGQGAVRLAGLVTPPLMAFAVVATANHFIVDVIAGGLLCLGVLALLGHWRGQRPALVGGERLVRGPRLE